MGADKNSPSILTLVNASETARNSDIKYWRNLGEAFDAKARLNPRPMVLNLVFHSDIKPELVRLTETVCDATHLIDRNSDHGPDIIRWLEANHGRAPSEKDGKYEMVRNAILVGSAGFDADFSDSVEKLSLFLSSTIYKQKRSLFPLWKLIESDFKSRSKITVRQSRVTLLRRGLARWLVFEGGIRQKVLQSYYANKAFPKAEMPLYLPDLGMFMLRTNGAFIPPGNYGSGHMFATTASNLRMVAEFFLNAANGNTGTAVAALIESLDSVPSEMNEAAVGSEGCQKWFLIGSTL